ncbi:type I-F CRISPR-associated endoribonuclease Cas6/Csy4 [Shewanella sp.]|uniref:type I-F CRISPR-associated endoribonuclease Cas6/Csy4 n=1 Tax=Shewanella sp. TaxID=50422 RepID=UPI001ED23FBC|nr:type I-F CRISPR-associated endoribonuclease Cas6/Csy4 [Shewanella sp.]NRB23692.1 type I-F CRISPR-associated endoribonuclease Cas6/Csy4 [Shewanella sp.]
MKYYLDITLLPDAEANLGFLWQKVYQQIHLALAEHKTADNTSAVAVSFPEFSQDKYPLGSKLRLFAASESALQALDIPQWLQRLTDYCHCTSIKAVPSAVTQYAVFNRVQFDTNIERMARRRAKRKDETLEQALEYFKGFTDQASELPFINMKSLSRQHFFRLFLQKKSVSAAVTGSFNTYGLSKTATVPWF